MELQGHIYSTQKQVWAYCSALGSVLGYNIGGKISLMLGHWQNFTDFWTLFIFKAGHQDGRVSG